MTDKAIREIQVEKGRKDFTEKFILQFEKDWNEVVKKIKRRSLKK